MMRGKKMNNVTAIFLSIILQSYPYIIIGALAGAFIELYLPAGAVSRWSGKNNLKSILLFSILGFVMPICECGIIPVVKRLRKKGVPTGPLIAYLLAAPAFQPIVMFSTYSAFNNNIKIALIRGFGSLMIAIITSYIVRNIKSEKINLADSYSKIEKNFEMDKNKVVSPAGCNEKNMQNAHIHNENCSCGHEHSLKTDSSVLKFIQSFLHDFITILKFLIIGAFISSAFSYINPFDLYNTSVGGKIFSIFILMFMAILLSVCSEADAFVAYSFNYFPLVSKMAFMWLGPVLDIKLILLYSAVFNRKIMILIFSIVTAIVTILSIGSVIIGI